MPKLNKVFLAIIVALLVTAVAEVIFIFVYKSPSTVPTPQIAIPTPTPTPVPNPAFNPLLLDSLKTWRIVPNERIEITDTLNGTIYQINKDNIRLRISNDPNARYHETGFPFINSTATLKFFLLNTASGAQTPITIQDLKVGDNVSVRTVYNTQLPPESAIVDYSLYKL